MPALLILVFLVVPLVELYVILQVGAAIGALETVALLLVVGVLGGWLVKREGLGVLRRLRSELHSGRLPGTELVDGFLILFGGALLLTPGFLTDAIGLALLVPPVRAGLRRALGRRFQARVLGPGGHRQPGNGSGYFDV